MAGSRTTAAHGRLDRLELLERLPAALAVAKRAARRRAEDVLELRLRRAAVRAAVHLRLQLHELGASSRAGGRTRRRAASRGPAAVILSVDHESSFTTSTSASAPSSPTFSSIARFITSSAGQPRNVGVNSTWTRPFWTSTERMTPRSTSETTGISGSGISSNAAQTCSAVTIARPPARSAAPSSSRPRAARARPCACRARPRRPPRRPTRAASASRCSGGSTPSAYGQSSSTAARKRGSSRRRSCHISACMRWYASSRLIFAARRARSVHQRGDADLVRDLVEPAARDRVRPVEQAQLDERRAAVVVERAVERERVRVVGEQLVHGARVADLVLRDRRERDVLLEHRRDPRPLRVAPADDELVVSQAEQQLVHVPPSSAP